MRKRYVVFGIIGICLVLAFSAFWMLSDANRYRSRVEANLRSKFGRDVHLGEMSVSFIPFGFRIQNAVIAEDPAYGTDHSFAVIDALYVQPRILPLFRGTVSIHSLQLGGPKLELIRDDKGAWNFTSLLDGQPLSLAKLKIENGQVAITDRFEREPRAVYDHIDITLHDYQPRKPFSVEARLHMPGAGEQIVGFKGMAGPIQRESMTHMPLDGKLELQEVALSGIQRFLKSEALSDSDGVLTGSGEIRNNGILEGKGHLAISDARIRGVKLEYPISADYDISSVASDKTVTIRAMNLKLDKTPVSVTGSIASSKTPVTLDLHVRATDGSISEMARLAAAFGIAFDAANDVSGRLTFDVHATGPADKPVLEGNAMARKVQIKGAKVQDPVDVNAVDLMFSPDEIRSNSFTAATGRTSVTAQFNVAGYATPTPLLRAHVNTGNAELGELIHVARAYGFAAEDGMTGSGAVTLDVGVNGPLKQTDKWAYSGTGNVRNATLRLPSLGAKPLEIRKADLRFSANSMAIDDLNFTIGETSARGKLTAHNLAAPRVEFALSADKVNAAEWHEMAKARPNSPKSSGQSLLARATGSGQLSAQTVTYDQLVLSNVRSTVKLDEGLITMSPISAGLYSGQEVGTIVMNVRTQPAAYSIDSKLQNIDANHFLSSVSSLKEVLFGVMSASTNGRFSATGSADDIARSLNGSVSLNLANGRLANMDILHQLAMIGKFNRTARAIEPFTRLIRLNGNFDITNGVARTNNLEAVIEDGSLAADGTVDLVEQKLNLKLTAVLSQDYSQTVGGMRVGGLLNTVLANQKGELVIPVLLSGTLKNPRFAPDFEKIARMKLENLMPTFGNPDKMSVGILGEIFGGKPGQVNPSPTEPPRPGNVLKDIFEGVLGNRRK
jgi:uncharacterized protein involved in outer membrane biogenesis